MYHNLMIMSFTKHHASQIAQRQLKSMFNISIFVAEDSDGKHVSAGGDEFKGCFCDDEYEVGEPIREEGAQIYAVVLSPDRKTVRAWTPPFKHERRWGGCKDVGCVKVDTTVTLSVDMKFAMGWCDKLVTIWSWSLTGERLVIAYASGVLRVSRGSQYMVTKHA